MTQPSKDDLIEIVKSFYLLPFQDDINEKVIDDTLKEVQKMSKDEIRQLIKELVLPETIRIVELAEVIKITKKKLDCILTHLDNLAKSPEHNDIFIEWALKNLANRDD